MCACPGGLILWAEEAAVLTVLMVVVEVLGMQILLLVLQLVPIKPHVGCTLQS